MKIRCFKHRGPLNRIERVCLRSFAVHHGEVELLTYFPIDDLPEGIRAVDANEILPMSSDLYRRNSQAGIKAMFRWKTLLEHGGCFISTDVLCIRPFDFDQPVVFGRKSDIDWCPWGMQVLIAPPSHPLSRFMLNRCLQPHFPVAGEKLRHRIKKAFRRRFTRNLKPIRSWMVGDEGGFQVAVRTLEMESVAQPIPVFYPIHEARWRSPYDETFRGDWQMLSSTRAVCLNSFEAERNRFDYDAPFAAGSLMDHYERQYLAEYARLAA
ncbi:hypothetical protein [Blastopirellula marina]|uniref:Alpha 1,4-glycosyltransferase domain-containing protein n=1 Tax=Blastopirellula marina TaxID=124 RepID=A0A2S8F894_9BACT|nr:hypothetical protein [Blastopirellula marina]PQO28154.1 hypothetical protein C5Y98_24940 [Blastopirellula marina]PTL41694.1 hypothetical protein C5Y97_24955 [Blastopirellula marina]